MHLRPFQSLLWLTPPLPHSSQWFLKLFLELVALTSEPRLPLLQHHRQDRGAPPGIRCFVLLCSEAVAIETKQQREAAPGGGNGGGRPAGFSCPPPTTSRPGPQDLELGIPSPLSS